MPLFQAVGFFSFSNKQFRFLKEGLQKLIIMKCFQGKSPGNGVDCCPDTTEKRVTVLLSGELFCPLPFPTMVCRRFLPAFAALLAFFVLSVDAGTVSDACTLNGKPLYGRVQVVHAFPDFRVQAVHVLPDLRVQKVKVFPNRCGQWQFVRNFPDFRIQFVHVLPDVRVQFVDVLPGRP